MHIDIHDRRTKPTDGTYKTSGKNSQIKLPMKWLQSPVFSHQQYSGLCSRQTAEAIESFLPRDRGGKSKDG